MGEVQRLHKPRGRTEAPQLDGHENSAHSSARAPAGPAWASSAPGAPFALGGVQRKVPIGASNDVYEREADSVASRVAGGQRVAPGAISSISPASLNPVGQRQVKPEEKKKDEKPAAAPVQREVKPEDKTKDAKSAMPVQREAKPPEKKKDEKPAAAPVQRATKPEEKKKDEKPAAAPVQRESKPADKKKDEKLPTAPVQRAAKPEEKKKAEKPPAPPVQRAAMPEAKKKDEKPAAPVQREVRPEDKKKLERDSSAPVQMQAKLEEKKKEEKPAAAPVQRAEKPAEKKKDEKPPAAPVQRESKPPDKKKDEKPPASPVQRAEKPPEKKKDEKSPAPVQREPKPDEKKKEEKPAAAPVQRLEGEKDPDKTGDQAVQTSRPDGGAASAPSMESAASHAIATKGAGEPLHSSTRGTLESGLGSDLSDVRVHNDSSAHQAAEALNARAFTHQSDIWLGRGESQHNVPLMAHEATHVLQQTGSVHRQLVQRAPADDKTVAPPGGWDYEGKEGKVQKGHKLVLPLLRVPDFKKPPVTPASLTLPKKTDEPRPDTQRDVWDKDIKSGTGIESKLNKKIVEDKAPGIEKNGQTIYFFELKGQDIYVIGSKDTIKQRVLRPYWDRSGKPNAFQVDHKQELQLGGSNEIDNMWLLDADANMSSGRNTKQERDSRIETLLNAAAKKQVWKDPPDVEAVRRGYTIEVEKVMGGLEVGGKPNTRWTREEIKDTATQLDPLKALDKKQIDAKGLQGTPSQVVIYTNPTGGGRRVSKGWKEGMTEKKEEFPFGKMFEITKVNFDRNSKKGSVEGIVFRNNKVVEQIILPPIPLQELDAVDYGGYISVSALTRTIQHELKLKGLSPIEIQEAELTEKGLIARGAIMPSIRPFDKLNIDLVIDGDNIYLSKMFSAEDFNFPGPIKVTGASLEIFAGTPGIGARGDVFFEVRQLGKGKLSGKASTSEGPQIEGDFDFDTDLFDPAKIHVEYSKGKFSGGGKIGIPSGKVRGIKSASIEASFAEEAIDAKGSIQPDIPAVEQADLTFHYDEKTGLTIAGDLQLKKDIPGIEGGSIHAEVNKKGEKYTVKASGEATPKIPGINSKLMVSYDDGAFDALVTASYEKGMLKGSVTVGATNRPVGDDGKPGPPPKDQATKIIIYGGGSATLRLAPWLQATAAIKFKPNGEVEVTGKIGIPKALNLFDEKKLDKPLFRPAGLDIPILGFSALGHRVGIFLNITGGVDLLASIGPGQLQDAEIDVTYNPAHEEDTAVHGHAALHIPAEAGLRLFASASIGGGILIVDARAGIELGATLGVKGALHADVDVNWTPKQGLVLDAKAEIYAEPTFKFDITGFVVVELDLLFTTKNLYEHHWKLKEFEYGSGLRVGAKLPVHYEEGKPFNVSLSDIEFEYPKIDVMEVIKGVFAKIV